MTDQPAEQEFEVLLDYLRRTRGFDFSVYKSPSLMRRIQKRMSLVGVDGFADYLDYLQVHPDEFPELFNMILINVTYFFRDGVPWEYIQEEIVPKVLEGKGKNDFIRVWSAGCASGEEAYTIAMVLAEALGEEEFRERVKIYATDLDEVALSEARAGAYSAEKVESVSKELLDKYFEKSELRYTFRKDLRRNVIFGRHNLIQDAPISRIDLLICRNTLMYFNSEAQTKILVHFHFALNETGYLFLGKSEMLLTRGNLFQPVDLKRRIFRKVSKLNLRDRLLILSQTGHDDDQDPLSDQVRMREAIFEEGQLAQIVVDVNGLLVMANRQARSMFGLNQRDHGRLLQDLDISYKPVELRSLIEQAYSERRRVSRKDIEWSVAIGDVRLLEADVMPLVTRGGALLGSAATFTDVTR